MLQSVRTPRRVLMTVDAVGGVWRYAMDLAAALAREGVETVFAGFGPPSSEAKRAEAEAIGRLVWLDAPLDWMAGDEAALDMIPALLRQLVDRHGIDLVHLNLPSQACRLDLSCPVVAVSHSCVPSWFHAVRGSSLPPDWAWHKWRNRAGFERADAVVVPSRSHGEMLEACYGPGPIPRLFVVPNATSRDRGFGPKEDFVFAAARWWDEGKNGRLLDAAAPAIDWPLRVAGAAVGPNGETFRPRHLKLLGEQPHEAVCDLAGRAAVFVSPSLYEPFGLAALEAAKSGAALVLADIPTYREIWEGAALFFDPRDADALAAAVNGLADDPDLRAELGVRSARRAALFTPEVQAVAMLDVYRLVTAAVPMAAGMRA